MITVLYNQSMLDIAIQESGSILSVVDICFKNKLSITDELFPGQKIAIAPSAFDQKDIQLYFKSKKQNIATGYQNKELINDPQGIGYFIIGINFKVA